MGKLIRIELVEPDDTSHLYFWMSQVPRIGDIVSIISEKQDDIIISGIVTQVQWLLNEDKSAEDNADCVVVFLGELPDGHKLRV